MRSAVNVRRQVSSQTPTAARSEEASPEQGNELLRLHARLKDVVTSLIGISHLEYADCTDQVLLQRPSFSRDLLERLTKERSRWENYMTYALGVQELSIRKRFQPSKTVFEGDFGKVSELLAATQSRLSSALRKTGFDAGAVLWEAFSELNQRFWDQFFAGKRTKTNDWRQLLEEQEQRIKELKEQLKTVETEKAKAVESLQAKELMVERLENVISTAQTDPSSLRTSVSSGKLVRRKSKFERETGPQEGLDFVHKSHDSAVVPHRSLLERSQKLSKTLHQSRSPGERKPASVSSSSTNVDFKGLKEQLDLVTQERNQLQELIRPTSPSHHLEALELEHTEEKRRLRSVISDLRRQLSETKTEDAPFNKTKTAGKSTEDYLRLEKERSQAFFKALKAKENECVAHLASLETMKSEQEKSGGIIADLKRRDEQAEKLLLKAQTDLERSGSLLKTLREEKDGQLLEIKQIRAANGVLDVKNRRFAAKIEELERLSTEKTKELTQIQAKIQEIDELKPEFESVFKLKSDLETVTQERDDYIAESQTLKESLQFYRGQLEATTKTLEEMREEEAISMKSEAEKMVKTVQDQIQRHISTLEKLIRDTEARLTSAQDDISRIRKKSDFAEKRRAENEKLTTELNAKTKKIQELDQLVERLKSELEGNNQDFEEKMTAKSVDFDELKARLIKSDSLLSELKTKTTNQESEKKASNELIERLKTDSTHQEMEIERLNSAISEAESALSNARKSIFFHESNAEKHFTELNSQKTTIKDLEEKTESMKKLNADLIEELETLKRTQENGAEREKLGWKKTEDALREQIRKLKTEKTNAELSAEGKDHELERLREELKAASGSKDVSSEREQVALSQLERYHTSESVEKQRLREENSYLTSQIRSLNSDLEALTRDHEISLQIERKRFEEIRSKNAGLETAKTDLEREVLDLKDNALAATQKVHSLQQEIKSRKADLALIQNKTEEENLERISALERSLETIKSENKDLKDSLEKLKGKKDMEINEKSQENEIRIKELELELGKISREKDAFALKFDRANSDLEEKTNIITGLYSAAGVSGLSAFQQLIKVWVEKGEELTELYADIGEKLASPSIPSVSAYILSIENRLFQSSIDLETFKVQISDLGSDLENRKEANSDLYREVMVLKSKLTDQTQKYEGIISDLSSKFEELQKKANSSESERAETAKKLEIMKEKRAEMAESMKKVLQEVQIRSDTLEREKEELSQRLMEAVEEKENREEIILQLNSELKSIKETLEKNQKSLKLAENERNSVSQTMEKLTKTHSTELSLGKTALERSETSRISLESELETLKTEFASKSAAFEELKIDHFRLLADNKRISDLVAEKRDFGEAENRLKSEIETLRQELKRTENSLKTLENDREGKRTKIDELRRAVSVGKTDLEVALEEIRAKDRKIQALETEGNEGKAVLIRETAGLRAENDELKSRNLTFLEDMETLRVQCQDISEDLSKSVQTISAKTAEISTLKEAQIRHEGEISSIQRKLITAEDLQQMLEERVKHLQNEVEEGKQRESALQIESKTVLNDVEKQLKAELNKTLEALRLSHRKEEGLSMELDQEKKAKSRIQEEAIELRNQVTRTQAELAHRNTEIQEFQSKTADLESRILTFSRENHALNAKNQSLNEDLAESMENLRAKTDQTESLQSNLKVVQARVSDLLAKQTASEQVEKGLKATIARLNTESEVQKERETSLEAELKSVKSEIRSIEASYKERLTLKERREAELTTAKEEKEQKILELYQEIRTHLKEIEIQKAENVALETKHKESYSQISRLNQSIESSKLESQRLTEEMKKFAIDLKVKTAEIDSLKTAYNSAEVIHAETVSSLTKKLEVAEDQERTLERTISDLRTEIEEGKQRESALQIESKTVLNDVEKQLKAELNKTLEALRLSHRKEEGLSMELDQEKKAKSRIQEEAIELHNQLTKTQAELTHRNTEIQEFQSKTADLETRILTFSQENELMKTRLDAATELSTRFSALQTEHQNIRQELMKNNESLVLKSRQIESIEAAKSKEMETVSGLNIDIQKLTKELEDRKQRETALEIESKTAKTDSDRLISSLTQELSTSKAQFLSQTKEIQRLSDLREAAEAAQLRLEKDLSYRNLEIADLVTKVKDLSSEIESLQRGSHTHGIKTPDFSDSGPETGTLDMRIPSFSDQIVEDPGMEIGTVTYPREIQLAAGVPNVQEFDLSTERESMFDEEPQFPIIITSKSEYEASKEGIRKSLLWIFDSQSKTTEKVNEFASKTDLFLTKSGKMCEELRRTREELRKTRTEFEKLKLRVLARREEKEEDEASNPEAPRPLFVQDAAELSMCLQVQYDGKIWILLKTMNKDYIWQEGRLPTDSNSPLPVITESIQSQLHSLDEENRRLKGKTEELEEICRLKSEELDEIHTLLVSRGFNFQGQTLLSVIKSSFLAQRRGPGSNKARSVKDNQPPREVIEVILDDPGIDDSPEKSANQRAFTSPHGNSEKLSESGNSMALSEAESQSLFKTIGKLRQETDELQKELEDAHRQIAFYKARLSEVQNQSSESVSSSQISMIVTSLLEGLTPQCDLYRSTKVESIINVLFSVMQLTKLQIAEIKRKRESADSPGKTEKKGWTIFKTKKG